MAPLALLDTDTLSEVMKGKDLHVDQQDREYFKTHGQFRISVITHYEILRGLKAKKATRQIEIFEDVIKLCIPSNRRNCSSSL
jgi:tRNA(fMet)-specific endonuclease VapC